MCYTPHPWEAKHGTLAAPLDRTVSAKSQFPHQQRLGRTVAEWYTIQLWGIANAEDCALNGSMAGPEQLGIRPTFKVWSAWCRHCSWAARMVCAMSLLLATPLIEASTALARS